MNNNNTLLYGGTFDPIHKGHIEPVIEIARKIGVDQVVYMPCFIPPHKNKAKVSGKHRLQMVQAALEEFNQAQSDIKLVASDYELSQQTTSYTLNTVQHFAEQVGKDNLYFLVGMDSLCQFHLWHKWQEILEFSQLAVMQRPPFSETPLLELNDDVADKLGERIHIFSTSLVDISSTQLRKALSTGKFEQLKGFIPSSVQNYISNNRLYTS